MLDIFKRTVAAGIGAASLTKEKAEKIVDELVEKGEVKKDEAKKFVNELVDRGEQEKSSIKDLIRNEFAKLKVEMGLVSKQDLEALEKRIFELETKLGERGE